jgi:hypothetical protein
LRGQDGISDVTSEAIDVESDGARIPFPVRMELQELVPELPLELAAARGHWPHPSRERGTAEGLNQRNLAASVPVGHVMQCRPDSQQCTAGGLKGITHALIEPGAHDAARGLELRVELVELDRRRELPIDQLLEICHHPVYEFPDRPKGTGLLGHSRVVGVSGSPRDPPCFGHASPVDGVGDDDGADEAEQGLKRNGGAGPLPEGLAHVLGHAEGLKLADLVRQRSPAAPRPLL